MFFFYSSKGSKKCKLSDLVHVYAKKKENKDPIEEGNTKYRRLPVGNKYDLDLNLRYFGIWILPKCRLPRLELSGYFYFSSRHQPNHLIKNESNRSLS